MGMSSEHVDETPGTDGRRRMLELAAETHTRAQAAMQRGG